MFKDILRQLEENKLVPSRTAAHVTAGYYQLWVEGETFDLTKSQVQIHRARLRKLGIDIGKPYQSEESGS